jgi:hypothetical protein
LSFTVISIALLVFAIIGSFVISISLNEIVKSFEGKCPLDAKLVFETKSEKAFAETGIKLMSETLESEAGEKDHFANLSTVFNDSYVEFLQQSIELVEYPFDQVQFLSDCE